MNIYATAALLIALALVQTTVMPWAALGGASPLLHVLAVVSWGLLRGPGPGVWWALTLGLLLDSFSPAPIGMYTLPLLAAVAVVAAGRNRLFATNLLLPGAVALAATAAYSIVQLALVDIAGGEVGWTGAALAMELREGVLPTVTLNMLWLPVLYLPLRAAARRSAPPRIGWER